MAAVLPTDLAQAMAYGPQTQQAIRRSQYLSDALKQLSTEGGQNIRSPVELGAKLIAAAILNRATDKAQLGTLAALRADQDAESAKALAPFGATAAPPQPAAPIQLPQQAAQEPPPPPEPAPQATPQPAGLHVSPQDRDALTRMISVEAGGEGQQGMAAAAHVALNRLKAGYGGAKSLSDVVYQPHQFEGIPRANQIHPQDYAAAQAVADRVLSGQVPDPTNGAMAFLNPDLQTKLGRRIPTWAQGEGVRLGNHVFFGGQPQPQQPPISAGADPFPPPPPPPNPNGPDLQPAPSAPGSPPVAGPPPAGQPPQASPAGGMGQWPTQKPSQGELDFVRHLLADPRTHQLGMSEAYKLQQKMTQPVPSKIVQMNGLSFYVPDIPGEAPTLAIPVPREAMTQVMGASAAGLPGAPRGLNVQRDPLGNLKEAPGAPPPGYDASPDGQLHYRQGGPDDPTRPLPPQQGFRYAPAPGNPTAKQEAIPGSAQDPQAPMNVVQGTQAIQNNLRPTIDLAVVAKQSVGAVHEGYKQQNGTGDIAMVNGLQHLIDKGVVRGEDVNMQMKSNGIAGGLGSITQYINSNGLLTPDVREKVRRAADALYNNIDQQYRAQVMAHRATTDAFYGPGAFDKYVIPIEQQQALGWAAGNGAPTAPPPPTPMNAPTLTPGTRDAAIAEARKRGLIPK